MAHVSNFGKTEDIRTFGFGSTLIQPQPLVSLAVEANDYSPYAQEPNEAKFHARDRNWAAAPVPRKQSSAAISVLNFVCVPEVEYSTKLLLDFWKGDGRGEGRSQLKSRNFVLMSSLSEKLKRNPCPTRA